MEGTPDVATLECFPTSDVGTFFLSLIALCVGIWIVCKVARLVWCRWVEPPVTAYFLSIKDKELYPGARVGDVGLAMMLVTTISLIVWAGVTELIKHL